MVSFVSEVAPTFPCIFEYDLTFLTLSFYSMFFVRVIKSSFGVASLSYAALAKSYFGFRCDLMGTIGDLTAYKPVYRVVIGSRSAGVGTEVTNLLFASFMV